MGMGVSRGMVHDAAKQLKLAWSQARAQWDDDVAREFEEEHLEPLAAKIRAAVTAMDTLAAAEERARRECE